MRHLNGQWQSLLDETASLGQEIKGVLTIAAPQPVLTRVLLAALTEFQQYHPKLKLVLQATEYTDMPSSQADLSFCRQLEKLDTATTIGLPLCDYSNSLYAAPQYLSGSSPQQLSDLTQHQCLAYGLSSPVEWAFANGGRIEIHSHALSNNTEVLIQSAIAGQGIVYIPGMIIQKELENQQLIPLLPELRSRDFQLWAYYQKLDYVPLKVRIFLDYLKQYFAD
jgi:DNA-binding transcriptional LysR family regulator